MDEARSLLDQIPQTLWPAIFGAVGAIFGSIFGSLTGLGGVLVSNRDNTKRLRTQLEHDGEQKAKERTATLRREVYMKAAEEMTKATHHVTNLPMVDTTKTSLADGMQDFFRAAAKVQLVCESNTAIVVSQLVATYGEVIVRLAPLVKPIYESKIDISIFDDLYKNAQAEVTRVLGEQRKLIESAKIDDDVFTALQRSFEAFQAHSKEFADARSEAWEKLSEQQVPFYKQLLVEMRAIAPLQISVLVEMRRDLGLTSDLDAYRKEMERQWESAEKNMETALKALNGD